MIAQDWKLVYASATQGTTITLGGSNSPNLPIMSVLYASDRYESNSVTCEFLIQDSGGAGYATFIANIRAVFAAITRTPRGRLTITLGTNTEADFDSDLTNATGDLAFDAEPEITTSAAPPNSGAARRVRLSIHYRRPSDLAGQYGRSLGSHGMLNYATQDRKIAAFSGFWTAMPGSPGKGARAAYQDVTALKGVDNYCRAWLATNGGSANTWALKSDMIEPTDTDSIIRYRREYSEVVAGRHESITTIHPTPSGRRTVTINGTYLATQTGGNKTALVNFNAGGTGAVDFCIAQCNAIDNTATWEQQWIVPRYEEKLEELSFIGVFLELFVADSGKAVPPSLDDNIVTNARIEYEVTEIQAGFSPDAAQDGGIGINTGNTKAGGGGGGSSPTRQITITGGSEPTGTTGTSALAGGGSGGAVSGNGGGDEVDAKPFFDVVIKIRADMNRANLKLLAMSVEAYFEANLLKYWMDTATKDLGKSVLSLVNFTAKTDASNSVLLATIHCLCDSGTPVLYADSDTTILMDPGRIFRKIIGGVAHQYTIQSGPVSGLKLREVRAMVRSDTGPSVSAFVLGDHADSTGGPGTWYVTGPPSVKVKHKRIGVSIYGIDVSFYVVRQSFVYVESVAGGGDGTNSTGGTGALTLTGSGVGGSG